jgi:hypothetical protein
MTELLFFRGYGLSYSSGLDMTMGLLVHRSFVVCVPLLLDSNDIRIKHGIESKKSFCGVGVDLQGPVNFVTLRCVTPVLRPLSMAMSTVVIHVFGDVPSAPIVGAFQVSCMVALFFLPVPALLH